MVVHKITEKMYKKRKTEHTNKKQHREILQKCVIPDAKIAMMWQ
jgi:hypothetical protein